MANPQLAATSSKRAKNVGHGVAYIKPLTTPSLLLVTNKETLCLGFSRNVGLRLKITPFAAQQAAEQVARKAMEHGVRRVVSSQRTGTVKTGFARFKHRHRNYRH